MSILLQCIILFCILFPHTSPHLILCHLCLSNPCPLFSFVPLAFFKVSENCHFELEDLPPELPPQL